MQGDFFQVLRRVQREERNKGALARVDNDFYKQLRDYIKDLENSVANNPFGNEQLLLNNAQRIATEICEKREEKITKAANNNIYRSFLLFKKDNPQFDLLDTTPLNLTDEEETLYFALMDALKTHRYRISLDEYSGDRTRLNEEEESYEDEEYADEDGDEGYISTAYGDEEEESTFVEDSFEKKTRKAELAHVSDDLEDDISNALGENIPAEDSLLEDTSSESISYEETLSEGADSNESDEVLGRLNQIKDAKVVTDEKYEPIDKQVNSQMYANTQSTQSSVDLTNAIADTPSEETKVNAEALSEETKPIESNKNKEFVSDNIEDLFKDPDSQFIDLDQLDSSYEDEYYNSVSSGSSFASPSEDDFNMIFASLKKTKSEDAKTTADTKEESPSYTDGFNKAIDNKVIDNKDNLVKDKVPHSEGNLENKAIDEAQAIESRPIDESKPIEKKPVDKTRGGIFTKDEAKNATVVIKENIDEIVGIDGKVYGPFLADDVVVLPNITAQIIIDSNKATLVNN